MGGDRTDAEPGAVVDAGAAEERPDWSTFNWAVIGLFTVLTLVGIALATGRIEAVVAVPGGQSDPSLVTVPLYVYLYSGFGALGYIFTKLMVNLDQYTEWGHLEDLVAMAMRVPAAWILATGIYLFLGDLGGVVGTGGTAGTSGTGGTGGTGGARLAAGIAFLVGLYVNVALKALGSLADRILGRSPRTDE